MDKKLPNDTRRVWPTFVVALVIALGFQAVGLLYYLTVRAPELRPFQFGLTYHHDAAWLNFLGGSLPSFVHAVGLFLVIACLFRLVPIPHRKQLHGWALAITVLFVIECTMGTTTVADVAAILLAIPTALFILSRLTLTERVSTEQARLTHCASTACHQKLNWTIAAALSVFSVLATASYTVGDFDECARFDDEGRCIERIQSASPIYMSYNELRSSVRVSQARPMDDVGRIYVFQNTLYVNERNRGIHVIDNTDPFDPQPLRFIEIPGNLDIEIRGSRLYADSFIDLVTLDISNPETMQEVDRQTDVFSWDENQNIPYNIRLIDSEVDRNLGVVIAYEVVQ